MTPGDCLSYRTIRLAWNANHGIRHRRLSG